MDINKLCKRYVVQTVALAVVLALLGIVVEKALGVPLFGQQALSTVFFLLVELTVALVWRWVMLKNRDYLSSFFMGMSGLRFFGALTALLIWFLAISRESIMSFIAVLFVYYMTMVVHQSVFFTKINKQL